MPRLVPVIIVLLSLLILLGLIAILRPTDQHSRPRLPKVVRIYKDDKVYKTSRSTGDYVIATASGRA